MHFKRVYQQRAADYDRMVAAEDCDGNLLPAMEAVARLRGARVVEVGVGTARVTRLLIRAGIASITCVDNAAPMLEVARRHLQREAPPGHGCPWQLVRGDATALPVAGGAYDVAVAGWVYGHMTEWFAADWRSHVDSALAELARVTRPGGVHIIIETLGTGAERPAAPSPGLSAYYHHLEAAHGFARRQLRTDYAFATPAQAAAACGFFFGDDFARTIVGRGWARVPEWTGLWWREQRC